MSLKLESVERKVELDQIECFYSNAELDHSPLIDIIDREQTLRAVLSCDTTISRRSDSRDCPTIMSQFGETWSDLIGTSNRFFSLGELADVPKPPWNPTGGRPPRGQVGWYMCHSVSLTHISLVVTVDVHGRWTNSSGISYCDTRRSSPTGMEMMMWYECLIYAIYTEMAKSRKGRQTLRKHRTVRISPQDALISPMMLKCLDFWAKCCSYSSRTTASVFYTPP